MQMHPTVPLPHLYALRPEFHHHPVSSAATAAVLSAHAQSTGATPGEGLQQTLMVMRQYLTDAAAVHEAMPMWREHRPIPQMPHCSAPGTGGLSGGQQLIHMSMQ